MHMIACCTCGPSFAHGPGMLAANFLYRSQVYAERTSGGKRLRRCEADHLPGHLLLLIAAQQEGDASVLFELDDNDDTPEADVRSALTWLDEHRFIALDGIANGVARVWVNPAVGCPGGTDPRTVAARHRFPYITVAEKGMSADQPVSFHEYSPALWEAVYVENREMFDQTTFPAPDCPAHGIR